LDPKLVYQVTGGRGKTIGSRRSWSPSKFGRKSSMPPRAPELPVPSCETETRRSLLTSNSSIEMSVTLTEKARVITGATHVRSAAIAETIFICMNVQIFAAQVACSSFRSNHDG